MISTLSHEPVAPVQSPQMENVSSKVMHADGDLLDRLAVTAFVVVAIVYAAAATYGLLW